MKEFERMMQGVVLLAALGHAMAACRAVEQAPAPPLEQMAVTDFRSVAGNWEGLMEQSPPARSRYDDWVRLNIKEDGTFSFEAYRTIGVFSGSGLFTLEDGALLARSEKGRISARLYRHSGQRDRLLKTEGTTGDGITYHTDLTPARRR